MRTGRPRTEPLIRFQRFVRVEGHDAKNAPELGPCWLWKGKRSKGGYGWFRLPEKSVLAHRWLYSVAIGPIPDGLDLDHFACDNGRGGCVNPWHCRPATRRENNLRQGPLSARYAKRVTCDYGHPFDSIGKSSRGTPVRICKTCRREAGRRYRARQQQKAVANV